MLNVVIVRRASYSTLYMMQINTSNFPGVSTIGLMATLKHGHLAVLMSLTNSRVGLGVFDCPAVVRLGTLDFCPGQVTWNCAGEEHGCEDGSHIISCADAMAFRRAVTDTSTCRGKRGSASIKSKKPTLLVETPAGDPLLDQHKAPTLSTDPGSAQGAQDVSPGIQGAAAGHAGGAAEEREAAHEDGMAHG